jgi:hypothetical protein
MSKKEGLILERHIKIGAYLNFIHEILTKLYVEISNSEGKTSNISKEFNHILEDLAKLRLDLEECMCDHYPNELNQLAKMGFDPLHIYYGQTFEN